MTSHKHSHDEPHLHADGHEDELMVRIQRLAMFLEAHFGEVELHMPEDHPDSDEANAEDDAPGFLIQLDDTEAFIDLATMVCFLRASFEFTR